MKRLQSPHCGKVLLQFQPHCFHPECLGFEAYRLAARVQFQEHQLRLELSLELFLELRLDPNQQELKSLLFHNHKHNLADIL